MTRAAGDPGSRGLGEAGDPDSRGALRQLQRDERLDKEEDEGKVPRTFRNGEGASE